MKIIITRESTWDYENRDEKNYPVTTTVETIETWEWSSELNRYELIYLEEKETGEYIPYNEDEYIRDGCIVFKYGVPCSCRMYDNLDEMLIDVNNIQLHFEGPLFIGLFQKKWHVCGEIDGSNAEPIVGYKKGKHYYIDLML